MSFPCRICEEELDYSRERIDHERKEHPKELIECPSCDKRFSTEQGVKNHHAESHNEIISYEESDCVICGDSFSYNPTQKTGKYCSQECIWESYRERYSGENHPQWKGGKIEKICDWCGKKFFVDQHRKNEARFCNHDCYIFWSKENYPVGEDHPKWKGYSKNYGRGWHRSRLEALERDEYECRVCGESNEEHIERYGFSLNVHHITPYREFSSDKKAHRLENLISLCKECHSKAENQEITT